MKRIDVPSLVTGLVLVGFAAVAAWFLSGHDLLVPGRMWCGVVLLTAGTIGLFINLGKHPGR